MRQLLFLFLFFTSTLFSEEDDIRSHFPSTSLANSDGHPNSIVDNKVCAITGDFVDYQVDMTIDGPEPLHLTRFNSDTNASGILGKAWDFGISYPAYIRKTDIETDHKKSKPGYAISVRGPHGGALLHEGTSYKKHGKTFASLKFKPKDGFTNCALGKSAGKSNPLNNKIILQKDEDKFELMSGSGDVRYYRKIDENLYMMYREWKANGISYDFLNSDKYPLKVTVKDLLATPYASLEFSKYKDRVEVTGSNGDVVTYCYSDHVPHGCISSIQRNNGPNYHYRYSKHAKNRTLITRKIMGNSHESPNWVGIEYFRKGKNKLTMMSNEEITRKYDVRKHRVKRLSNVYGVTHEFSYNVFGNRPINTWETAVVDAAGNLTIYGHDPKYHYLDTIERFSNFGKQAQLLSIQYFGWSENGLLDTKVDANDQGIAIRRINYDYDSNYNIATETLKGDLTGWKNYESYQHWYKHSDDGYNNLLSEGDDEGPTVEYVYLPCTDLLTARYVIGDKGINLREYKSYDERRFCVEEIYDNGSGRDSNDLTSVTEPIIVRRLLNYEPHQLGKPNTEAVYYLDTETNSEVLLKMMTFQYDHKGRAIEKNVYDSQGAFCYSLKKAYDDQDNVIWENDQHGHVIEKTYDEFGKILTQCGPERRHTVKMHYDAISRPVAQEVCHQDGSRLISFTKYNQLNQVVSQTDALGRTSHFKYDALGHCILEQGPATLTGSNNTTHNAVWKEYDIFGNVTKITGNDSSTVQMEYNIRGNITSKKYLDGSFEKWVYSLGGRLLVIGIERALQSCMVTIS